MGVIRCSSIELGLGLIEKYFNEKVRPVDDEIYIILYERLYSCGMEIAFVNCVISSTVVGKNHITHTTIHLTAVAFCPKL